jgi:hypothetical protein
MPRTHATKSQGIDADLSASDRLEEIACLLAIGVLRLHGRVALTGSASPSGESREFIPHPLEVPRETVLSVHTG